MNTAGIIFLSLGILFLVIPAIISLVKQEATYMAFSALSIVWFLFFPLVNFPKPTKKDVKDGKAIYVEEANIGLNVNGDTLYNYSTYRLEWLPEWKYGRKQKVSIIRYEKHSKTKQENS